MNCKKVFQLILLQPGLLEGVWKYLSNTEIDDIDIATTLSTDEIKERFKNSNFKVIETGTKHGTITLVSEKFKLELTTLRKDVKTDGRHAEVEYIDNWQLDLKEEILQLIQFILISREKFLILNLV